MSVSNVLYIPNEEYSSASGLTIESGLTVEVSDGGILEDSVAKKDGMIIVNTGGIVRNISATEGSLIYGDGTTEKLTVDDFAEFDISLGGSVNSASILKNGIGIVGVEGTATDVTVTGGSFQVDGGTAAKTTIAEGGAFTVQTFQYSTGEETTAYTGLAQSTTILDGGSMRVEHDGVAQDTILKGGQLEVNLGEVSGTIVSAGTMTLKAGNTARGTTLEGGKMVVSGGVADDTTIREGAVVSSVDGVLQNMTMTGGSLQANSTSIFGLTMNGGTAELDAESALVGKVSFAEGAAITVNGLVEFDTQYATKTEAQISGFSLLSGDAKFSLTVSGEVEAGDVFLLASGVTSFTKGIAFDEYTLSLGADPVVIGDLSYSLALDGDMLGLVVDEYTPEGGTIFYVNSEWESLKTGDTVVVSGITATIGTDAFATGDAAALAAAGIDELKIKIIGGTVSFSSDYPISKNTVVYSGATLTDSNVAAAGNLVVNSGAILTGKAAFAEGASVTVKGTVVFDTSLTTAEAAQFSGFAAISGDAMSCTLVVADNQEYGTFLLATEVAGLDKTFTVRTESGVVLGELAINQEKPTNLGNAAYTMNLGADCILSLVVQETTDVDGPTITVTADPSGPTNQDVVLTAVFEDDVGVISAQYAFGEPPETEEGWIDYELSGVTVTENEVISFRASDAAGHTSVKTFDVNTIDRIRPKVENVQSSTSDPTDKPVVLTADFWDNVAVATQVYRIGGTGEWKPYVDGVTVVSNSMVYFQAVDTAGNESDLVSYAVTNIEGSGLPLAYVNSEWASAESGTVIGGVTIGYNGFAVLGDAISAVTEDGAVEVVDGEISFADGYSKTVTVDSGVTVFGKAVFAAPITINGTMAFDTQYASTASAQFGGLSFVAGSPAYTLTADPVAGSYMLATDAAGFDSEIVFGDNKLTVGGTVLVGIFNYTLGLSEKDELVLSVSEYVPPTPVYDLVYANSAWSKLENGTEVTIREGVTATIGADAFASADMALLNVTEEGTVEVVGGEVSFIKPVTKAVTIDAGVTLTGKASFATVITVNGTVVFDTAFATAEAAQFNGLDNLTGSATYMLNADAAAAGTYLLATVAAEFNSDVAFRDYTLTVGGEAVTVDGFTYALGLTEKNELALTVSEVIPTYDLVYVNSAWATLADGTEVTISETVTAIIGANAFATGDQAIQSVTEGGTVEVVGGEVSFSDPTGKAIVIDAGATLIGKAAFGAAVTIDGTIAFSTDYATAAKAQITGFNLVSFGENVQITITDTMLVTGDYILADNASGIGLWPTITVNGAAILVNGPAVELDDVKYTLVTNDDYELILNAFREGPEPTVPEKAYLNSDWAGLAEGAQPAQDAEGPDDLPVGGTDEEAEADHP